MKNPLRYQMSEYDCGPTTLLNAISFLFEREEIPPEIIRSVMLYSLDCFGADGISGKRGTSRTAMMFLSNWFNGYGATGQLNISSQYMSGDCVCLGKDSVLTDGLRRGGVACVRVFYDEWHYVLLTGCEDGFVFAFDPYYREESFPQAPDIRILTDSPLQENRAIPEHYLNREELELYALGPKETREAVLLFNERSKLTEERTVEYFI